MSVGPHALALDGIRLQLGGLVHGAEGEWAALLAYAEDLRAVLKVSSLPDWPYFSVPKSVQRAVSRPFYDAIMAALGARLRPPLFRASKAPPSPLRPPMQATAASWGRAASRRPTVYQQQFMATLRDFDVDTVVDDFRQARSAPCREVFRACGCAALQGDLRPDRGDIVAPVHTYFCGGRLPPAMVLRVPQPLQLLVGGNQAGARPWVRVRPGPQVGRRSGRRLGKRPAGI